MKSQKGFSMVLGLLIIIIVGVLGFAGFYLWNQQKDENRNTSNTQASDEKSSNTNPESSKNNSASQNLEVAEWGVQFNYGDLLGKVGYNLTSNDDSTGIITFTADSSIEDESCIKISSWGIAKYSPDSQSPFEDPTGVSIQDSQYLAGSLENGTLKKVGENYYKRFYPQQSCSNDDKTVNTGTQIDTFFKQLFDSARSI